MIQSVTAQQTQPGEKKQEKKKNKQRVRRHNRGEKINKGRRRGRGRKRQSRAMEQKKGAAWVSSVKCSQDWGKECYPQPVEAGVVIEELHLFWWQGSQHFLDGEELVDLTLSREQRLPIAKLS